MKYQTAQMARLNGCIGCWKSNCKWNGVSCRESDHYTKGQFGTIKPNSDVKYTCNSGVRK